ncbi:MAG TPA: hypothetical protein V6D10_24125 [Trichocoleus sp.]|jgi:soluble cytochrome b562
MAGSDSKPSRRPRPEGAGAAPRRVPASGISPLKLPSIPPNPAAPQATNSPIRPASAVYPGEQPADSTGQTNPAVAEPTPLSSANSKVVKPLPRIAPLWLKSQLKNWQLWAFVSILVFSGVGVLSAIVLLKLPALPNCPSMFLPTASASLRLYCAQVAAQKRTVDDLLKAIDLVEQLPQDHPLRPEIDRSIEEWSTEILTLAEESFQTGKLDKAVETARRIPSGTSAQKLVDDQIKQWKTVWTRAEGIYKEAEDALREQKLRQAFLLATRLLGVGNKYWETTQYRALSNLITTTRDDSNRIDKAKGLAERGGLDNLLAGLKLIQEIQPKSYLFAKAQGMIVDFGRDLLDLAEVALDQRNFDQAMNITRQIPDKAGLQAEVQDFNMLAEAHAHAWNGTVPDLESAIVSAQRIRRDRPLYGKAQDWISRWQLEIKDVTILDRAKQIADPGTTGDLRAAIAEARQIPLDNPRGKEAQTQIEKWTTQIETTEDQPILDRAEQLASGADIPSLQAAISEASQIQSGRALYGKAQDRIQDWRDRVDRYQDQPILDQAKQLADSGDFSGAIQTAEQIGSGRSLYQDAQSSIRSWRDQQERLEDQPILEQARQLANQGRYGEAVAMAQRIGSGRNLYDQAQTEIDRWSGQLRGKDRMQQAYDAANVGTSAMLVSAIRIANSIPANNPARSDADRMIDQWSQQLLQRAESQSVYNLQGAIDLASSIPQNSSIYAAAQTQIQTWQRYLKRN